MTPTWMNAVKLFETIQKQFGNAALAYWVLPNVVLTFSGCRPYCDGVFWDDNEKGLLIGWSKELSDHIELLKTNYENIVWSDAGIMSSGKSRNYAGYDLMLSDGLRYALDKSEIFDESIFEKVLKNPSIDQAIKLLVDALDENNDFDEYSHEDKGHFAHGFLLGYPAAATKGMLSEDRRHNEFSTPMISADIRGGDYYPCPQPIYMYPRELVQDPTILENEKLWSDILIGFYTSDFHTSLAKDELFQAKLAELNSWENP